MIVTPHSQYDVQETTAVLFDRALVTAFLENFPDLVYFKDLDSRFTAVSKSKAARHRLAPAEILGKTDADFYAPEFAQMARAEEEEIMKTGKPMIGRQRKVVWADGREGWAVTSKMPLHNERHEVIGTFGITKDISAEKQLELDLEKTHRHLVDASRGAGMAEIATGVLHNVGNVLTSLNVSASIVATGFRQSKADSLAKISSLLQEHEGDLAHFLTHDPKGKRIPEFLATLSSHAVAERDRLLQEISSLQKNVDHIKDIVSMQQTYATAIGLVEPLDAVELMEDSLRMNASALVRHDIRLERDFQPVPPVLAERGKVIQILVNLIRNAKYADDQGGAAAKLITVSIRPGAKGRVQLIVADSGIGIPAENLERIFVHGFTTRANGHGFGLHSSVNAAKEMKGSLTVYSEGLGKGATFTLDLPVAPTSAPTLPS